MVFLRPVVVHDVPQADAISLDRYDLMRSLQLQAQPAHSPVMPPLTNDAAILQTAPAGDATDRRSEGADGGK